MNRDAMIAHMILLRWEPVHGTTKNGTEWVGIQNGPAVKFVLLSPRPTKVRRINAQELTSGRRVGHAVHWEIKPSPYPRGWVVFPDQYVAQLYQEVLDLQEAAREFQ